jgi:hypothetical protein
MNLQFVDQIPRILDRRLGIRQGRFLKQRFCPQTQGLRPGELALSFICLAHVLASRVCHKWFKLVF